MGFDVDQDADAGGRYRSAIEVKVAVHLGVRGELGIDAGSGEEIQCELGLWQQLIPEMTREVFVDAA